MVEKALVEPLKPLIAAFFSKKTPEVSLFLAKITY